MDYKLPLDIKYLKYVDKGFISKKQKEDIGLKLNINEIFDLFCLANNKKKLAALDFSNYDIKKIRIDSRQIYKDLKWKSKLSIDQVIKKLLSKTI